MAVGAVPETADTTFADIESAYGDSLLAAVRPGASILVVSRGGGRTSGAFVSYADGLLVVRDEDAAARTLSKDEIIALWERVDVLQEAGMFGAVIGGALGAMLAVWRVDHPLLPQRGDRPTTGEYVLAAIYAGFAGVVLGGTVGSTLFPQRSMWERRYP